MWHEHYATRVFRKAVTRANATIREANQKAARGAERAVELAADTTSHDLRHHYASVLLAARESVVAVAERLGHDDAALVLSVYGHLMLGSESRTRKAVDSAWDPDPAGTVRAAP